MPPETETAAIQTGESPPPPPGPFARPPAPVGSADPPGSFDEAAVDRGATFSILIGCPSVPAVVTDMVMVGDPEPPAALEPSGRPDRPQAAPTVPEPKGVAQPGTAEAEGRAGRVTKGGSMEKTIVARGVIKSFGSGRDRTPIVRGVSLSVSAGETVFLVGPSGSGKTTLLSILGCILTPDEGSVEVLGRDVSRMRRSEVSRFRLRHLGFIFQTFNLFPTLSALDNVQIALAIRGVPRPEARDRAAALLERVGLSHRLGTRPARLSTGESQRVAIARALAGDPSVLLADEPTASLDAENGQAVMQMLSGLARDIGLTLLIVTHDNRIVPFADRILRLEDGRLAGPEGGVAVPHFHHAGKAKEALA